MLKPYEERRKRVHRSGALGMVLAEAEANAAASTGLDATAPSPALPVAAAGRSAQRFFPTKGFGRVPATACKPWRFADRPSDEFAHTAGLAKSMEINGQVQPALVRLCHDAENADIRYEVIAGVARWRSALGAGAELDIQIRELTDAQAYRAMVAENEDRQNLSDHARAKRFARALEAGLVASKTDLAELARMSASQLSYFLGFASLPSTVVSAASDIKAMPARTGYVLSVAVKEGFESQIIRDMPLIESGAIQRDQIPAVWRVAFAPSGKTNGASSPVRLASKAEPTIRKLFGVSGVEVGRLKTSGDGALTLKLPAKFGSQLNERQIAKLVAVVEELANSLKLQ